MTLMEAMKAYLKKQELLYKKTFGTLPTISWDESLPQNLFVGTPDEDDEIQWTPKVANQESYPELCKELNLFYCTFYYWTLRGKFQDFLLDFPPVPTSSDRKKVIEQAVKDGNYYFPGQNTVLLASCSKSGNDDLLLFYRQKTGEVFIYDTDKRFLYPLEVSLVDLIGSMEAVI